MDNLTPAQRKKNMKNIRSVNTLPELLVAKELRKRKIHFTRNVKTLKGKPDFLFRKKKVVVFIDSDFWHGHPTRCRMPKSNRRYWNKKIKNNRLHDFVVNRTLKKQGWTVVRIWEIDLKKRWVVSIAKITKSLNLRN